MINEILGPSASVSTETKATKDTTLVVIEGQGGGNIWLEVQVPGGNYTTVVSDTGARTIDTPDYTVGYRFRGRGLTKDARVYFGAETV